MSCWRKYTADVMKNVDKDKLHEACVQMGFDFDESRKTVHASYERRSATVDAVLKKDDKALSLGFLFDGDGKGHLTVEGDFWGTGLDERTFMGDLGQIYAAINLKFQLQMQFGMSVDIEQMEGEDLIIEAYSA